MTTPVTRSAPSEQTDGGFTHRQIVTILIGLMMGMFLAALDQTIVSTAIRTIADDLNGFSLQAWATTAFLITSTISTPLYGKLSDIYGRKPFFLFAIVDLHRRLGAVRAVPVDVRAGRVPGDPGHRRRRPVLDGAGDHRRHRAAAGAGPLPGLLPGRVRHVQRARPGARRLLRRRRQHPRRRRLALDLLHQRADRAGRAGRGQPGAAHPAHPPRPPHRLAGRGRADRRPGAAADRRRAGPHLGLVVRPQPGSATASASSVWSLFFLAERMYGDEALLPLRLFRNRTFTVGQPVQLDHRHGHVRRDPGAAALPADRQGLHADPGRLSTLSAGARHHGRLDHLRPDDLPDRPLPDLPDHRHRVDGRRRCAVLAGRRGHPAVADGADHADDRASGSAATCSRSSWPSRTRCRRARSASRPRR